MRLFIPSDVPSSCSTPYHSENLDIAVAHTPPPPTHTHAYLLVYIFRSLFFCFMVHTSQPVNLYQREETPEICIGSHPVYK